MQYTINQLRTAAFRGVYQVYEVFQNHFGENSVDLQNIPDDDTIANFLEERGIPMREDGSCYEASEDMFNAAIMDCSYIKPFILVYWPEVKVTNENDKSIIIQDLYAKVELTSKGCIPTENRGFTLNRATYPKDQWECSYMHSHISNIPKHNLQSFQLPCLGSGPILSTINSLRDGISEGFDEIEWMLFCEELSRYVHVESLAGVPYNRLENIHQNALLSSFGTYNEDYGISVDKFKIAFSSEILKNFILYYLQNGHLSINYQDHAFCTGMPYFDYIIDVSNSFIEFFNANFNDPAIAEECFNRKILLHAIAAGGKFYDPNLRDDSYTSGYIGQKICTFKGRDITLNILDTQDEESQQTTVMNHGLAMYILNNIIKIINYHYTNEYTRQHCQGSTATLPATTSQRVYYI